MPVAIVTGGSRGIGAAIAKTLGAHGYSIAVNFAVDANAARRVVDEVTALGAKAVAIQADVSREDDIRKLFETAERALGPLVVLVNQYSASASEITAGALQDTKIGTLIGVKTYGKGVVQTLYPFSDSSEFKITTARYVTPLGRDINKKGIEPDVVVDMDPRLVGVTDKDVQLRAALSDIEKQLALASH